MKIENLMTVAVQTCRPTDSLSSVAQTMWSGDLGCLPVVDESERVVGMITDRDMLMAAHLRGAPLWALAVADAMASVVFSVPPSASPREALRLMESSQIRRLPVVDTDGRLCGLVTLGALACAVASSKAPLAPKDVAAALATVSGPRPVAQPAAETLVVEVTRSPKDTLQPAPRKAKALKPAAPKAKAPSKAPKAKAPKAKAKARAGK